MKMNKEDNTQLEIDEQFIKDTEQDIDINEVEKEIENIESEE